MSGRELDIVGGAGVAGAVMEVYEVSVARIAASVQFKGVSLELGAAPQR